MFGIDEAGRGPAIGSLFVGGVSAPDTTVLPEGLTDSKQLSHAKILDFAEELRGHEDITVSVTEIPPETIDNSSLNLTTATAHAFAKTIQACAQTGDEGWLDACHPDAATFEEMVVEEFETRNAYTVHAEHSADETYAIVSAASVIAKAAREQHVSALAEEYGEIGSGYPSDPTTREFLEEYVAAHGELPDCARASWGTCEDIVAANTE